MKKYFLWLGLLLLYHQLVAASPVTDTSSELDEIIQRSGVLGLSVQAKHLAQQALIDTDADRQQNKQLAQTIAQTWGVQALTLKFTQILEQQTPQQQQQLLRLLTSAIFEKSQSIEQQAISQQGTAEYSDYLKKLRQLKPAQKRLDYITALDQQMKFTALLIKARASIYQDLEKHLPNWQAPNNWQNELTEKAQSYLFYAYRSTPNHELEQLIKLYQNPAFKAWLDQVEKSIP